MIEMTRQQVLRALADGASAGEFVVSHPALKLLPLRQYLYLLLFDGSCTFYRKPKTHIVNGFEVEAPMTEAPTTRIMYYKPNAGFGGWFCADYWADQCNSQRDLARKVCFATQEGAIANAKAQLGFDPNGETP